MRFVLMITPILLVAAVVAALASCGGHRSHSPAVVVNDKASDCWAHPDVHGRRHCAS